MIDEQKLRELAEDMISLSKNGLLELEDVKDAPSAILALLDELQSLRSERTAWRVTAENAEAAVKQARIDALEEAKKHLVTLKDQSLSAQTKDAAPMTFADDVNKNIRLATVLLAGAFNDIESLKGKTP
jgi:hypothetical protein